MSLVSPQLLKCQITTSDPLPASSNDSVNPVSNNSLLNPFTSFEGRETGNQYEINWRVQNHEKGAVFVIEKKSRSSDSFTEVTRLTETPVDTINNYSVKIPLTSGLTYYRLTMISSKGKINYSRMISSYGINHQSLRAFITGTNLLLKLPSGTTSIEIFDASGKSLKKQETDAKAVQLNISLTDIAKGILTVRALADSEWQVTRVLY